MPRFFINPSQIGTDDRGAQTVRIVGDDARHITKSLRMREGETLTVCDMACTEYTCRIRTLSRADGAEGSEVIADVLDVSRSAAEPPYAATLYQALCKGDKFDAVVQKAVECGVTRIVPVLTERCVVRLTKAEAEKKRLRWQRIAGEAAKQCGRGIIPEVSGLLTFSEAVAAASGAALPLFCYENERACALPAAVAACPHPATVSLLIGSEGGFSPAEAAAAAEGGMRSVGLGRRILRTETASSFVLACLSYALELGGAHEKTAVEL